MEKKELFLKDGDKIIFTGDSVTDSGRKRPVGEGLWEGTGNGYVRYIESMLTAFYPERFIHVVNTGISGNTSSDLLARFENDVIDLKPNYCVICIGFNDVWRHFDEPTHKDQHINEKIYGDNLQTMLDKLKKNGISPIFITPYYLEGNKKDAMRVEMENFRAVMKEIAYKNEIPIIDLQPAFDKLLKYRYPASITWDRVHPGFTGSVVIANEFFKFAGFDYNRLK